MRPALSRFGFKVKDATLCVLGRILPMEENYRLVQEAEEAVRLTPRLKERSFRGGGHIFSGRDE